MQPYLPNDASPVRDTGPGLASIVPWGEQRGREVRRQRPQNQVCVVPIRLISGEHPAHLGTVSSRRYIKDTNTKNDPSELNSLIKKSSEVLTWTPRPGATLDLGRMLKDPTDRFGSGVHRE